MNVGSFNRLITIESRPTAKDSGGEYTGSWSTVCTPWSLVKEESSNEANDDGSIVVNNITTFWIRYRTTLDSSMRILYNDKYYQITGIQEVGFNEYLKINAMVKTNW